MLRFSHRSLDPVFAVSIGVAAAVVRINKDEKAKGNSTEQIIDTLKRRLALLYNGDAKPAVERTT